MFHDAQPILRGEHSHKEVSQTTKDHHPTHPTHPPTLKEEKNSQLGEPNHQILDSFLVQIFQLGHDACSSYLDRLAPTLENWSHVLTIHTKVQCWFPIFGAINRPTKKFQCPLLTTWNPSCHLHFPNRLELWKKGFSFCLILCCYKQVIHIHQNQNEPSFGRQSKQGTFKSVFSS